MTAANVCDPLEAFPEHQAWLRTALLARLGCAHEVEEVMQEVAIAAATQSAKREPVERVAPWLYRVALRQMMLFRRKAGRRKRLIENAARLSPKMEASSRMSEPLDWLITLERQSQVQMAMRSMSERDRQLLMLKYVDGLSYGEIAQRIGVSASSVQSRLHRARALLRAVYGGARLRPFPRSLPFLDSRAAASRPSAHQGLNHEYAAGPRADAA